MAGQLQQNGMATTSPQTVFDPMSDVSGLKNVEGKSLFATNTAKQIKNAGFAVNDSLSNQSTTTLSSDKTKDIMGIDQRTQTYADTGLRTTDGVTLDASGKPFEQVNITETIANPDGTKTTIYSDGTQRTSTPKNNSISPGGYIGETYYAPGAALPKDEDGDYMQPSATSPTNDFILNSLNDQIAVSDAFTAAMIGNIKNQFVGLVQQQERANTASEAGLEKFLEKAGSLRYTQSGSGAMASRVNFGIQAIGALNAQEQTLILQAQQAGMEKRFQVQDKINDQISTIRKEKQDAAIKLSEDMAETAKEARESAYKARRDSIGDALASKKLKMEEKQQLLDEAYRDKTIDLDERQFLQQQVEADRSYELQKASLRLQQASLARQYASDAVADAKEEADIEAANKVVREDLQYKVGKIEDLKDHSGLDSRVGPNVFARGFTSIADRFGAGQDFAAGVQQITNKETLDNLLNLKRQGGTLGALSDKEAALLSRAATQLDSWELKDDNGIGKGRWNIDEARFKEELETLQHLARVAIERAGGPPANLTQEEADFISNDIGDSTDPAAYY